MPFTAHEFLSFKQRQASMPLELWLAAHMLALRLQGEGCEIWFVEYWFSEQSPHVLMHYRGPPPMSATHIDKDLVMEIVRAHPTEALEALDRAFEREFGKDPGRASPEVVTRFHQSVAEVRSWIA